MPQRWPHVAPVAAGSAFAGYAAILLVAGAVLFSLRDESAARLRRIERDLHDGAQVRLAALAMTLGEIKENLEQSSGDDRTLALAGAAHQNAKDTLAELRDLARGIHPPVLDRGLGPALGILAGISGLAS